MVKAETEAPVLWRQPSATATPSTPDKRASPRLYSTVRQNGGGDDAGTELAAGASQGGELQRVRGARGSGRGAGRGLLPRADVPFALQYLSRVEGVPARAPKEMVWVQGLLNKRPRKVLGYRRSDDALHKGAV